MSPDLNNSLWLSDAPASVAALPSSGTAPSLRQDVIVVGGGLAGLCTALRCAERGAAVTVIEAGVVAGRTTGHSTAKITSLHGLSYAALVDGKGAEAAATYARVNQAAVTSLVDIAARLGIDCDLVRATAYTCAETDDGARDVEREFGAATAAGLAAELVTVDDLPIPIRTAIAVPDQARFDPVAFCLGLAAHLRSIGVHIIEGVRIRDVTEDSNGCTVRAEDFELAASFAVLATHLPIVDPALIATRTRPQRSYVVAGPASVEIPDGMYLSADRGWSLRRAGSARAGTVLAGGEGHPMVDHVTSSANYERLGRWAEQTLGLQAEHRWSAFDYMPVDGVPFIGRLAPTSSRRLVATGFRKWGMSTSMVAADLLADHIDGRNNDAASLFDSTRILPKHRSRLRHQQQQGRCSVRQGQDLGATDRACGGADTRVRTRRQQRDPRRRRLPRPRGCHPLSTGSLPTHGLPRRLQRR